jgi:hypothetical protein
MRFFSLFLITLLIPAVAVMPLRAELAAAFPVQAPAPSITQSITQAPPPAPSLLKIRLDDTSKATVEANSVTSGYAVLITDAAGVPVADTAVAIRLPEDGATGAFVNGERALVTYTDKSGVARFPQVNWGAATGSLSIRVTAVKGEQHAGALIEQTVIAPVTKSASSAPVAPFPSSETVSRAPVAMALQTPSVAPPSMESKAAESKAAELKAKTPGVPASVQSSSSTQASTQASPQISPQTTPAAKPASADSVSVVNTAGSKGGGGGVSKKWVIIGVVLAGVGLGAALALAGGKSNSTNTPAATTTIGSPTISIGH